MKINNIEITDDLVAAFVDGKTNWEESKAVITAAEHDQDLKDFILMYQQASEDLGLLKDDEEEEHAKIIPMAQPQTLPLMSKAATTASNDCVVECERYVLGELGMDSDFDRLKKEAEKRGILKAEGVEIYNIGRLLEADKLSVVRIYEATLENLYNELEAGCKVIVAVDGNELLGDYEAEKKKDAMHGETANHAVAVVDVDKDNKTVSVHDPASKNVIDEYPIDQFLDAWHDSRNFMVSAIQRGIRPYTPHPIDINDIKLPDDIEKLKENIAENAHEVWAQGRINAGWSYGPKRNDELKQTPDLVPYCELTDSEKEYDRSTALQTLKVLYKLGYKIVKG